MNLLELLLMYDNPPVPTRGEVANTMRFGTETDIKEMWNLINDNGGYECLAD